MPWELGRLQNLVRLDVSYNRLAGLIPGQLTWLHNLEVFAAQDNELDGPVPWNIGSSPSLERVLLRGNEITGDLAENVQLDGLSYWAVEESSVDTGNSGSTAGSVIGTHLLRDVPIHVEQPSVRRAISEVMSALVIQDGLVRVRNQYVPRWIDREQLDEVVDHLNDTVRESIGSLAIAEDLVRVLEVHVGDKAIELFPAAADSPSTLVGGIAARGRRGNPEWTRHPRALHEVEFDCSSLNAQHPHVSSTEPGKIKGKVGGSCTVPIAGVTLTLHSYLSKRDCWWIFCWWGVVDSSGPHTRSGPTARWNPNTTAVRTHCADGLYATTATICPSYVPEHRSVCGYKSSGPVFVSCP